MALLLAGLLPEPFLEAVLIELTRGGGDGFTGAVAVGFFIAGFDADMAGLARVETGGGGEGATWAEADFFTPADIFNGASELGPVDSYPFTACDRLLSSSTCSSFAFRGC